MSQEEVINKYDRLQSFIHRMLNRLVLLGVIFTAGAVTNHYLRYKSLSNKLAETRVELDQSKQNKSLSNKLAETQVELDQAKQHAKDIKRDKA